MNKETNSNEISGHGVSPLKIYIFVSYKEAETQRLCLKDWELP